MSENVKELISDFVDYLMPELVPYEASLYIFLLRNSILRDGSQHIRIGKRTMAQGYGTGSRGSKTNYAHMTKVISGLEQKGCLKVGDTTRQGTLYTLMLPRDVPMVQEGGLRALSLRMKRKTISRTLRNDLPFLRETSGPVSTVAKQSIVTMPLLIIT